MPVLHQQPQGPFGQAVPPDTVQFNTYIEGAHQSFEQIDSYNTSPMSSTNGSIWSGLNKSMEGFPPLRKTVDLPPRDLANAFSGLDLNSGPDSRRKTAPEKHDYYTNNNSTNINNNNSEFVVQKEDFPALNQSLKTTAPRERPPQPQPPPTAPPPTSTPSVEPMQDNYDMKSFFQRFTNPEYEIRNRCLCRANIDLMSVELNMLHRCGIEVKHAQVTPHISFGITLAHRCGSIYMPEDPRHSWPPSDTYRNATLFPNTILDDFFINDYAKERCHHPTIELMTDDTAFFFFYFYPGEVMQLIAANSLFRKRWRYNKKVMCWCKLVERNEKQVRVLLFHKETWTSRYYWFTWDDGDFETTPPIIPFPDSIFPRVPVVSIVNRQENSNQSTSANPRN